MELIRDIRAYPWLRITGCLCLAAPLLTSLYFHPDWQGPRASASIAIWIDATLRIAALSLSFYRLVVTWRGDRPFEQAFQTIAIWAPAFFESSSGYPDADTGMPVWELLLADRGGVIVSIVAIVGSLAFIAVARFRRPSRSVRLA